MKKKSILLLILVLSVFLAPVALAKGLDGNFAYLTLTDLENVNTVGENFCSTDKVVQALKIVGKVIIIAKLAIPIIIVAMGTKDFVNTILSGKEDQLKKDAKSLGLRVVIGLFIFFVPSILNAFLNGLTYFQIISDDVNMCQNCLLDPTNPLNCNTGVTSSGQGNRNTRGVDYTEIDSTRNVTAEGELPERQTSQDIGNVGNDPNKPVVDAGNVGNDPNTPNVTASTKSATPNVDAGNIDPNTPNVTVRSTVTTKPVIISN